MVLKVVVPTQSFYGNASSVLQLVSCDCFIVLSFDSSFCLHVDFQSITSPMTIIIRDHTYKEFF
jgi:hypothetical protein